jgi:hypothetical protein
MISFFIVETSEIVSLRTQFTQLNCCEDAMNVNIFDTVVRNAFPEWIGDDGYFIRNLFRALDTNKDNLIDFKDLVKGLSILCRGTFDEKIHRKFIKITFSLIIHLIIIMMMISLFQGF